MTATADSVGEDAAHCSELVRKGDRDRYLASLFAPAEKRPHLMALYAFDVEISRIRQVVSEPGLGEIRLQWWAETIEALYRGGGRDHPVGRALGEAIAASDLPMQPFLDLIEARRFDLYDDPFPTMGSLEGYAGETRSAMIQMAAVILVGTEASRVANAAGHAGVARTIVDILRAVRADRVRGRVSIPEEVLVQNGLRLADVLAGRWNEAMRLAFLRMRLAARRHMEKARGFDPQVPIEALPALLPMALLDLYLARMGRRGFNPFKRSAEVSPLRRQWRLLRASWDKAY